MTHPIDLPVVGKVKLGAIHKESLLAFWEGIVQQTGISLRFGERLEAITPDADGYLVRTSKDEYTTANILLGIGRRGTPRKLGVPGEELPKVVYRLIDAEQYQGQRILVVGGGDSAIEAALALAQEARTTVTLCYRGEAFGRAKPQNREAVAKAQDTGRVEVLLGSEVRLITHDSVVIEQSGRTIERGNDIVIVCAGGILPTPMLQRIGIMVETKYGTA